MTQLGESVGPKKRSRLGGGGRATEEFLGEVTEADSTDNTIINDVIGNKTDAAVTTPSDTGSIIAYLKGLLGGGSGLGNVYYVSTTGTDSAATPGTESQPFLTINYAVSRCTANNNDAIVILPGAYDENANAGGVVVNKAGITITGPDEFCINNQVRISNSNGSATAVFTTSVSDVKIINLQVLETTPTVMGIEETVAGGNHYKNIFFNGAMENGIRMLDATTVESCYFEGQTNDAIEMIDPGGIVKDCIILAPGDNGINCAADECTITGNTINGNSVTTNGINTSGDSNMVVGNRVANCTNQYVDSGANNKLLENYEGSQISAGNTIEQDLKDIYDVAAAPTPTDGTHSHANNITEQDVVEFADVTMKQIKSIFLDTNALTQNATVRVKVKIDGTNYRTIDSTIILAAAESQLLDGFSVDENVKITLQSSVLEGAIRSVPYKVVKS